jgi:tetratricopeptide (TPR) repeat protein
MQLLEESIAIYREVGDKKYLADALNSRSYIAMDQADYPLAQSLLEESQILFQDAESLSGIGWTVSNLGFVALHQKDYARARQFFEEGYKIRRDLGEKFGTLLSLISIGTVSIFLGDLRTARIDLEQALNGLHKVGYKQGIAESLEGLAGVAGASGNPRRAARLFGAAEALREASRAPMSQAEHSLKDPMIKDCQSRMNKDEFVQSWSVGRQMLDEGLDGVIAYALEPDEAPT